MYFAAFKISATIFEDLVASLPHFAAFWPLQFHRLPTAWCEMPWRVPRRFLQHLQQFQLLPPGRQVLRAFLRSCRQPARQSARFNRLKASNEATKAWFLSQQWNLDAVKWCSSGWFLSRKDQDLDLQVFKQPIGKSLPHFLGYLYSQDAASMLPAEVLKALLDGFSGNSPDPLRVQDLCAAPGGKAIQLAEALELELFSSCPIGPMLVANDPNPERAMRLRANLLRCGVQSVMVSELPGEDFSEMPCVFHAVLVDAPCSAEANVRRDRRVLDRWRVSKQSEAYLRLLRRQQNLLQSAWTTLKPGGYLVYSTCTFNYFENEEQCEKLIAGNPDARVVDLSFRDWGCSTSSGKYLRLWPHSFGTEGFFVAAFQKTPDSQPQKDSLKTPSLPRFRDLFSKFRLLDWRVAGRIRKEIATEVGYWPNLPGGLLVEDDENLWLLPLAARLRWPHRGDSGDSGCMANHPDEPLRKVSNCVVQMSVLSKLKPCLRVARKVRLQNQIRYVASNELLMMAGDRYRNSSHMTPLDWAALELKICDSMATRNAHLSLLAAEGKTNQVYHAFTKMLQARLQLDGASYSALVTALVAGNNVSLAQDLSRDTSLTSLRRESFNKILNGFALRGDDASIRQIMLDMRERKLSPDVVSYNTLLKALKRHKTTCLEVPTFLEEMKLCTVQPNHVTFSSLMSLAAKFADARSVEDLIQRAKSHGVEIGTFAFNSLISAHIKVSDLQSAHAEVKRMQKENLDPDVVTYTTMMKGQREEVVLDLLEDMRNNIVKPNSVSFTTLLSSLTRAQQVTAALEIARNVHQEANATGSPISSHLACAILHVCAKAAEQSEQPHKVVGHSSLSTLASQVFQLVKKPDAACRNAFSAVSKAKESGREIQQQKRV